jgi:pimeloyl-ACP methyl ester carboxylesterase
MVAAAAETVTSVRQRFPRARLVIVGDSGGAALAANLAGVQPHLVDGIVLVSCPCALPEWRAHLKEQGPAATFAGLDPLKTAGGIAPTLRAAVLVGADDAVTPVNLSRAYAEALTLRGIATDYRIVPGKGHDLLDDPEVLAATERLAAALRRKI